MNDIITCPACQQTQKQGSQFCSFCYAPFDSNPSPEPPLPKTGLYRPADFIDTLSPQTDDTQAHSPQIRYNPAEQIKKTAAQEKHKNNLFIRLLFSYQAISPLIWMGLFGLSLLSLFLSFIHLIPPSFPYYLGLPFGGLTGWGLWYFYRQIYPLFEKQQGGFLAPVQKTLLSLGPFCFLLLGWYLLHFSTILGGGVIVFTLGGLLIYGLSKATQGKHRKNPIEAFLDLANTTERVDLPGIIWIEKACLAALSLQILFGLAMAGDALILLSSKSYSVKILGKEITSGGRSGPQYHVSLSGWPDSHKRLQFKINRGTYNRLIQGQNYQMQTRRGLFGGERWKHFKPAPNP